RSNDLNRRAVEHGRIPLPGASRADGRVSEQRVSGKSSRRDHVAELVDNYLNTNRAFDASSASERRIAGLDLRDGLSLQRPGGLSDSPLGLRLHGFFDSRLGLGMRRLRSHVSVKDDAYIQASTGVTLPRSFAAGASRPFQNRLIEIRWFYSDGSRLL